MDINSNVIERAAEAACQAWMKTDLGITMPDRSAADLPLGSQEWADFWQSLGTRFRTVFRMQAEAALCASGMSEKVAALERRIDGAKEALAIPYPSSHAAIDTAVGLAKRYLRGGFEDEEV